jgi:hypothetical protein
METRRRMYFNNSDFHHCILAAWVCEVLAGGHTKQALAFETASACALSSLKAG